jgi:hypothetical protein
LVPEANAPSHAWLVTEKIGKDGREEKTGGQQEQYDWHFWGNVSRKMPQQISHVSPGAQQVSPRNKDLSTHFHVERPVSGILTQPKQAS